MTKITELTREQMAHLALANCRRHHIPRALTEALVGLVQDGMIVFDPRTRKFYAVNHCREVVDAYFEKLDADAEGEGSN